jgi:predicted DNA-binding transcriptional regulator YafY
VSDADWLVRHVLRYGGEAEVLEPEVLRRRVAETARRIAGG